VYQTADDRRIDVFRKRLDVSRRIGETVLYPASIEAIRDSVSLDFSIGFDRGGRRLKKTL
jgi:hypothetical protein